MKYDIIYLFLIFNNCLKPKIQQTIELLMDNGLKGVEIRGWDALGGGETGGSTTMNSKARHASYVWFMNYAFSNYYMFCECCLCRAHVCMAVVAVMFLLFLLLFLLLHKLFIYFSKWKHKLNQKNKKNEERKYEKNSVYYSSSSWKNCAYIIIINNKKHFFLFSGCFCLFLVKFRRNNKCQNEWMHFHV